MEKELLIYRKARSELKEQKTVWTQLNPSQSKYANTFIRQVQCGYLVAVIQT